MLDELPGSPTSTDVMHVTDRFEASTGVAVAVRRALAGGGSQTFNPVTVGNADSPYTAAANDFVIADDENTDGITINLPASPADGAEVAVWLQVFSGGNITVTTTDATTINGEADFVLVEQYSQAVFLFDGTEWTIVSQRPAVLPSWIMSGTTHPVGNVTPASGAGTIYSDFSGPGGLYIAIGPGADQWVQLGGHNGPTTAIGVQSDTGAVIIIGPSKASGLTLTDKVSDDGLFNGLNWDSTVTDGEQQLRCQTGDAGQYTGLLQDANGNLVPANTIDVSNLPTSNPGPNLLWNNAGALAIGT